MALAKDLSDLPSAASLAADGFPPDAESRFVHLLADQWKADNDARDSDYQRRNRFHLSDAGKCARAIAYAALEVPATNPMDLTGIHNTRIGSIIHEAWQDVIRARYPHAEIEPRFVILDGDGSGYSDLVTTWEGRKVSVELKTLGGFAYKMAIGERGAPQGPKAEHLAQGALNAKAADADELVIAYLAKEVISVNVAKRKKLSELHRFCAEWTLTREQYMPIAEAEERRVAGILGLLDEGVLPARRFPVGELPEGHRIVRPEMGAWEVKNEDGEILDAGTFWACAYCKFQDACATTSADRQPIAEVAVTLGLATQGEAA